MSAEVQSSTPAIELPKSLSQLATEIDSKTHQLASSGNEELAAAALQAAKDIFELGQYSPEKCFLESES
jgi:flagellar biosynthesis/type III secretory pathway ATPase